MSYATTPPPALACPSTGTSLGDGEHTIIAYLDGIEFARTVLEVTTLGEEFVHDAHGTCTVDDFPLPDHSVNLVWQEAGQHFALSNGQPPPPVGATHASDVLGRLETPAPGSFQSGRGSISGWVCDAEAVSIEIDGTPYPVAYGTARADTADVCENPAPGFGLSLDWNRLGPGDHEVVALADGAEFGRATVRVTTLGAAFRARCRAGLRAGAGRGMRSGGLSSARRGRPPGVAGGHPELRHHHRRVRRQRVPSTEGGPTRGPRPPPGPLPSPLRAVAPSGKSPLIPLCQRGKPVLSVAERRRRKPCRRARSAGGFLCQERPPRKENCKVRHRQRLRSSFFHKINEIQLQLLINVNSILACPADVLTAY